MESDNINDLVEATELMSMGDATKDTLFSVILPARVLKIPIDTKWPQYFTLAKKRTRFAKPVSELRLRMGVTTDTFITQYMPLLEQRLYVPMVEKKSKGIPEVIEFMDAYCFEEAHWSNVAMLTGKEDALKAHIPSQTRAAFTRRYRATEHPGFGIPEKESGRKRKKKKLKMKTKKKYNG
jgi:hypothetical protein